MEPPLSVALSPVRGLPGRWVNSSHVYSNWMESLQGQQTISPLARLPCPLLPPLSLVLLLQTTISLLLAQKMSNPYGEIATGSGDREADVLLQIDDIQVYSVEGDNSRQLVCTDQLNVLATTMTAAEKQQAGLPADSSNDVVVLVIGEICLPLVEFTPTLRLSLRNYMIGAPNGKSFVLLFPQDCEESLAKAFEQILQDHSDYKLAGTDGKVVAVAGKATGVVAAGGTLIAAGVGKGAQLAVKGIRAAAGFIKGKVRPKDQPVHISANVMAKAQQARMMSAAAVTISTGLVNGVVAMSGELAKSLADGISKTSVGQKIANSSSGPKMQAAKDVGFATLKAVNEVWDAMASAGLTVVDEAGKATADVVGHRYGSEAKMLATTAGAAVTDLGVAAINMKKTGIKAIVAGTAKQTAVEVMHQKPDHSADALEGHSADALEDHSGPKVEEITD